ncbi:hypothetical protein [Cupriavidus basilensis]|uniref:hypothetical protein n=1 Tax=Cupriavidus basilensis TaxID=68895 RepID=UPI0023E88F27|nr:hypothetical protein [Cupriavidus basilensis]MDF3887718.1 hypothetical protein [Cupriavidus basilensis]
MITGSQGDKGGKASAGNIDILAQNVTIAEGVDRVYQDASQRSRSSGIAVALVGTPLDTAKNLQAVLGHGRRAQRVPSHRCSRRARGLGQCQCAAECCQQSGRHGGR